MEQLDLLSYHIPRPCPRSMPDATANVLQKLKNNGVLGVTWDNFPRGFALRSRISDLRKQGYMIHTDHEHLDGGCIRARYILLGGL